MLLCTSWWRQFTWIVIYYDCDLEFESLKWKSGIPHNVFIKTKGLQVEDFVCKVDVRKHLYKEIDYLQDVIKSGLEKVKKKRTYTRYMKYRRVYLLCQREIYKMIVEKAKYGVN